MSGAGLEAVADWQALLGFTLGLGRTALAGAARQ